MVIRRALLLTASTGKVDVRGQMWYLQTLRYTAEEGKENKLVESQKSKESPEYVLEHW
jgi:hypothetical protein